MRFETHIPNLDHTRPPFAQFRFDSPIDRPPTPFEVNRGSDELLPLADRPLGSCPRSTPHARSRDILRRQRTKRIRDSPAPMQSLARARSRWRSVPDWILLVPCPDHHSLSASFLQCSSVSWVEKKVQSVSPCNVFPLHTNTLIRLEDDGVLTDSYAVISDTAPLALVGSATSISL